MTRFIYSIYQQYFIKIVQKYILYNFQESLSKRQHNLCSRFGEEMFDDFLDNFFSFSHSFNNDLLDDFIDLLSFNFDLGSEVFDLFAHMFGEDVSTFEVGGEFDELLSDSLDDLFPC